jgi:hypothetical protein
MKAYFKFDIFTGFYEIPSELEYFKVAIPAPINMTRPDYEKVDMPKMITFRHSGKKVFQGEEIVVYERVNDL